MKNFLFTAMLCVIGLFLFVGCSDKAVETMGSRTYDVAEVKIEAKEEEKPEITPVPTATPEPIKEVKEIDYQKIKPNEVGHIIIVMYHGIVYDSPSTDLNRNVDDFKNDLQQMYDKGYRLVPIEDVMANKIDIEAGYSPIVLTFDDGLPSAFSLDEVDGKLVPKENCAVDIINKFAEKNPDFGRTAVFYINGTSKSVPFTGSGTLSDRFNYLIENGYTIGNHTFTHSDMSKLDESEVQKELADIQKLINENTDSYKVTSLAYPFGVRPKEELRHLSLKGSYDGTEYNHIWALKEGKSTGSSAPNHIDFDPLNIPRVRGSNNAITDLGWCLDYYEEHPELRYISDGDPDRISVPQEYLKYVEKESLNDKILYVYDEDGKQIETALED